MPDGVRPEVYGALSLARRYRRLASLGVGNVGRHLRKVRKHELRAARYLGRKSHVVEGLTGMARTA
jgi:hypothetical protein